MTEFSNPHYLGAETTEEMFAAGEHLMHSIFRLAEDLGMETGVALVPVQFPLEFGPLLGNPPICRDGGRPGVEGGDDPDNPAFLDLTALRIRTYLTTYPEIDEIILSLPEHHGMVEKYRECWDELNRKYDLESLLSLEDALQEARSDNSYPGGGQRVERNFKGSIVSLYVLDKLLTERRLLEFDSRSEPRLTVMQVQQVLFPILKRVLPPETVISCILDYGASRTARRLDAVDGLGELLTRSTILITYQDDNIGILPQLETAAVERIVQGMMEKGMAGYHSKSWMIGDLDPVVNYLARASWYPELTLDEVLRDHVTSVYGPEADFLQEVFEKFASLTSRLGDHALGLGFPTPAMIARYWECVDWWAQPIQCDTDFASQPPLPAEIGQDREEFREILALAKKASARCRPAGRPNLEYLIGRLEFAIAYLDTVEASRRAGSAYARASDMRSANDPQAARQLREALDFTEAALKRAGETLHIYAAIVRDDSDRGTLAQMNTDFYQYLVNKQKQLQKELEELE
jgi:hypothetical protein